MVVIVFVWCLCEWAWKWTSEGKHLRSDLISPVTPFLPRNIHCAFTIWPKGAVRTKAISPKGKLLLIMFQWCCWSPSCSLEPRSSLIKMSRFLPVKWCRLCYLTQQMTRWNCELHQCFLTSLICRFKQKERKGQQKELAYSFDLKSWITLPFSYIKSVNFNTLL